MATVNLGAIRYNWKGAWDNSTNYVINDVVSNSGNSYICIQAHSNQAVGNATAYWNIMSSAGTNGTNGTDVGTTITTQGDILFRDGSGLQRLAKGTAAQVLSMNAGATAPEWAAAASGDCVKLTTANAAGAADIYMDNVFTNTYKYYRLVFGGVKFSSHTAGAWLRIGFRTGGASGANHGGSYHVKYKEQYNGESSNTNGAGGHQSDSTGVQIWNTWNLATDGSPSSTSNNTTYAPYRAGGWCDFFWPTQDNWKPNFIFHNFWNDSGHVGYTIGGGYNDTKISSGGITGLRINSEGHNIAAGFFTLYAFKL